MERRAWWVLGLYALLALLLVPVYPHFQSPNELTRWAAVASLVEHGSLEVSSMLPYLSSGFEDLSVVDGRTYSNKAPGAALVALPGYLAVRPFTGPPSAAAMRTQVTAMRLCAATLPALGLALLLPWAAARLGGEVTRGPIMVLALLFATPLFAYGLLLFAHALAAFCLFGAWACLFVPSRREETARRELLAGALLGLAVFSEYPMAVPALALVVIAATRRRYGRLLRLVAGGLPFAVALALYDRACFGGVLELSSAHEKYAQFQGLARHGLFGVGTPRLAILWELLLGTSKGLLVFSPFLLLTLPAIVILHWVLPRDAFAAFLAVPLSVLLVYGGYPNWHGGWSVGARYLVSVLPFAVFPLGFRRGGRLEAAFLGWSVLAVTLTTLVFPFVPRELPVPWATFALPLLLRGLTAPNALHLLWRPAALAAPFVLVAVAVALALRGKARLAIAGAALALVVGLSAFRPGPLPLAATAQRAYVEDVFFDRAGALERELGLRKLPPALESRRQADRALPPAPWPF